MSFKCSAFQESSLRSQLEILRQKAHDSRAVTGEQGNKMYEEIIYGIYRKPGSKSSRTRL